MKRLKQFFTRLTGLKVGLLTTTVSLLIYIVGIPFFQIMDLKAFDFHFKARGRIEPAGEVVIAAIDEKSLDRLGRWPWPRRTMAGVVRGISDYDPAVIAFDVVFSEPEETSGVRLLRDLKKKVKDGHAISEIERLEGEAGGDSKLAGALKDSGRAVLGYFFFMGAEEALKGSGDRPDYLIPSRFSSIRQIGEGEAHFEAPLATGVARNIPVIAGAAENFGYFNIVPDIDGTVRWASLVIKYKDEIYPHVSVEALRKYLGDPPLILNVAEYGVDSISIGGLTLPTDERGRLLINFRGGPKTFQHYSIADIVDGSLPEEALRDKIVIVGATATGIYDMRVTPFSSTFPGVEVNANIIDTIIQGDYINRPDWILIFDLLSILIPGVVLSIVIPRVRALFTALLTVVMAASYIFANDFIFRRFGLWLTDIYPVFTILFVSICTTTFQFISEERKKREIREAFSHYVDRSVVEEIIKNPDSLFLGGEEKRLTVLFSDIRGFTTVAEKLKPQVLVKLINDYLTPMTDVILRNGGTVDKYMGDAIMAFWGAPLEQPDHPVRACRAALEMVRTLDELQKGWEDKGIPRLSAGIGLSSGKVVVGNMGSHVRFDYTVIGDTVNLGSRLEGLNKEYGTNIIAPKFTYEAAKDDFIFRQLDLVKVKGKNLPIRIYELMGEKDATGFKEFVEVFETGLLAYRARAWDMAEEYFRAVLEIRPEDGPSRLYLARVKALRETELPDDWDGVFVAKTK